MSIDINKIIYESIQHTIDNVKEPIETLTESTDYHYQQPIYENYQGESNMSDFNSAMASAISAGLGALTFRNKLRSLEESRLSRGAKVGLGVGAAGLAGAGGLYAYGDGEGLGRISSGARKVGGWFSRGDKASTFKDTSTIDSAGFNPSAAEKAKIDDYIGRMNHYRNIMNSAASQAERDEAGRMYEIYSNKHRQLIDTITRRFR